MVLLDLILPQPRPHLHEVLLEALNQQILSQLHEIDDGFPLCLSSSDFELPTFKSRSGTSFLWIFSSGGEEKVCGEGEG
ncbi:hypothetical protein Droror1_Dr00004850 [Drosera rotundifolia]